MRTTRPLLLLLLSTPFLWQCASQQDMHSVELRMRTLDTRLVDLNRNIDHLENRTVQQAAMGSNLDRLEAELLQAKALIDENIHFLKNAEKENNRRFQIMQQEYEQRHQAMLRDFQQRLTQLEQQNEQIRGDLINQIATQQTEIHQLTRRLEQASMGLEELRRARVAEAAEQAAAAAKAAEQARQVAAKASEPREIAPEHPPKRPAGTTSSEESTSSRPAAERGLGNELYERAYSLLKSERYKEAYNAFLDFIEKNPGNSLMPSARFWLADSLYQQKEYELAILEYQKVISDYPKDSKAPAAMLKQGLAFEQLKDKETARIIYRKLQNEYPGSEQAGTAKTRMDKM
jgi:tol-pal system protein YbgF